MSETPRCAKWEKRRAEWKAEWEHAKAERAKAKAIESATAALIAAALAFIDLKGIDIVAWASLREAVAAYRKATEEGA